MKKRARVCLSDENFIIFKNSKFYKEFKFCSKCIKKSFFLIGVILIVLSLIYLVSDINISGNVVSDDLSVITKDNFVNYLEKQTIVKELPRESIILLKLFSSENAEFKENYVIKKASIKKGNAENPDFIAMIDSKYLPEIKDLCSAIKKARANGDLNFELKINYINFLWKYKGMLKYKNCFGI